jgi:hypothetical protein
LVRNEGFFSGRGKENKWFKTGMLGFHHFGAEIIKPMMRSKNMGTFSDVEHDSVVNDSKIGQTTVNVSMSR